MGLTTRKTVVTQATVGRLDRAVQRLAGCSRSQLRGLFDHGCVRVNGDVCSDFARPLQPGDQLAVRFDRQQKYTEKKKPWRDKSFSIVYEDEFLIVVDKSSHVLSVPTDRREKNTLLDRVSNYLRRTGGGRQAIAVQRLDRGVSGLMVMAKSRESADRLIAQFRERKPDRAYYALALGRVRPARGTFESRLATAKNLERYSTEDESFGETAITHYQVKTQFSKFALVEVRLETGKRNQIRVHFAEAGHPILGDSRYGKDIPDSVGWTARRIALHAAKLSLQHPHTRAELSFESPMPLEMQAIIDRQSVRKPNHKNRLE